MLWVIAFAGLTCIFLILLALVGGLWGFIGMGVWGFIGISYGNSLVYKRNEISLKRANGKKEKQYVTECNRKESNKNSNSFGEISENQHQEFVESLARSSDTSIDSSIDSTANPCWRSVPVQPIHISPFTLQICAPYLNAYQSQRVIKKQGTPIMDDKDVIPESDYCSQIQQGVQDQLLVQPTMILEMRLCEETGVIFGTVKYLNVPRDQRVKYPEEVCFRVTKLPNLQNKQLVYKTWWREYTSSLVNLTFRLSGMKSTDSMRIRLYGRYTGASSPPKEICYGERVIHMKDITFEMSSYTYDLFPKGSASTMDEKLKRVRRESGYSTQSLCNSNDDLCINPF